ncbi:branched-chain amino acid aminotransferase [Sphingobacterium alimentarium]|uniref:branched-chain-amino-acid transaminase n=1 Tax=Sphingobacterium alimentarium TaxID=797292 RepID=A0A4R3VN60_9SPHI|nr:aminotransferase class IV [Sphingobacterium alimentarium]TCV08258.1 branched-chain amino acid aminotransferase [Sphingobacterium alimentarium]
MPIQYINFNGEIVPEDAKLLTADNRGFRYGDGLFETMLYQGGEIRFLHLHIERLQRSMQTIQLEQSTMFDEYFVKKITDELIRKNNMVGQRVRVRLTVFRDGGGLYTPAANKPAFILQVQKMDIQLRDKKVGLIVDLYTELKKPYSDLSAIKSNNSLIYVLAGNYKKKFDYDDVFILNQEGFLCEALTSNLFIYYDKVLYTPALNQGCIDGVMRRVVMDMAEEEGIPVVEAQISPEIMKTADELFCTNAVQGIQWVMGYKQKRYFNKLSRILQEKLLTWSYDKDED